MYDRKELKRDKRKRSGTVRRGSEKVDQLWIANKQSSLLIRMYRFVENINLGPPHKAPSQGNKLLLSLS
jgi:hypothetical protein